MKFNISHFSYANINPKKDWYWILTIFIALSILGVIYGAYKFYTSENHIVDSGISSTSVESETGVSRLHKIVSDYEMKREAFNNAKTNVPAVIDPSL